MRTMRTDSLSRLSAAIENADTLEARSDASASLGIKFAQFGRISEAHEILSTLRQRYSHAESVRTSIRIILLEGVLVYYENRDRLSFDRTRRANALAKAARILDVEVETAIWLAHLSFNFEEYKALQSAVVTGFEGFDTVETDLKSRLCLVVADAYQFLGERATSFEWYSLARAFARKAQDRALIVAIEYNRLAMGLSRVQLEQCIPSLKTTTIGRDWLIELSSVQGLHKGFSVTALNDLLTLSAALTFKAKGDFQRAQEEFLRIRDTGAADRCGMSDMLLELQIESCRVMAHGGDEGYQASLPSLDDLENLSHNDQLIALKLINDISEKLNLDLNQVRFDAVNHRCTTLCLDGDEKMREAISVASQYLNPIKHRVNNM